MGYFYKLNGYFAIFMLSFTFCIASENSVYGSSKYPEIRSDALDNLVSTWIENTGTYSFLEGTYSSTFPDTRVTLTDNTAYSIGDNVKLALSSSTFGAPPVATTVALYGALDLNTFNSVILASIGKSDTGWDTTPRVLFDNLLGNEIPLNDHRVFISADGQTIIAVWGAYDINLSDTILRYAISTDGGANFSTALVP